VEELMKRIEEERAADEKKRREAELPEEKKANESR